MPPSCRFHHDAMHNNISVWQAGQRRDGAHGRDRARGLRYNPKNMLAAASDPALTVDFVPVGTGRTIGLHNRTSP
jgi:hypothetical protein